MMMIIYYYEEVQDDDDDDNLETSNQNIEHNHQGGLK